MSEELKVQLRLLQDNLEAVKRLKEQAEAEYRRAMDALRRVAYALVPRELDNAAVREGRGMDDPDELAEFVIHTVRGKLASLELLSRRDLAGELGRAKGELEKLRGEVEALRPVEAALQAAQARIEELQAALEARDAELVELRRRVRLMAASSAEVEVVEDEVEEVKLGDPDLALLRILGFQGLCLRPEIEAALEQEGVLKAGSGTAQRLWKRMRDAGLVEVARPLTEGVGRTPHLVRLTQKGREVFRQRFGREPVASLYDRLLARHKSNEHVFLNLQAAAYFKECGGTVDLFPAPITLKSGGTFDPDLVVALGNKTYYVECERARKRQGARERKWSNVHEATGGEFTLVVPNTAAQNRIMSEISRWALQHRKQVRIRLVNLAKAQGTDGVWTMERDIAPK